MAIPQLSSTSAATLLFTRLPDRLFAPLSSVNRHKYWALLCRLHEQRFGPDAPMPPSRGFPSRVIVQDIIDALELQDVWDNDKEDSFVPGTPAEIRAAAIFNRLHECGWLHIDQPRFEKKVTMRPAVSQFLTMLVSFAETGPVFVSGKIRSIDANLQMVIEGKGNGDSLAEAAEQARNLLEHVRNTGTDIRELMSSLGQDITTSQYVQIFFNDYIERVFIGDYRELRTKEHPLSKRGQILSKIESINESEEHRNRLIAWYESKRCSGDVKKAERLFQRDIQRLSELQRINEYLERLDTEIRRANKRALAFLDYRLRSLMPIDNLVKLAIKSVLSCGEPEADPFAAGELLSEDRLSEPKRTVERAEPSSLRKVVVSEEQRARSNIMVRARQNRTVSALGLSIYAKSLLAATDVIKSEDLKISSISDVRMYQTLSTLSLKMSAKNRKMRLDAMTQTRGFKVVQDGTTEVKHEHISGVPFFVEARTKQTNRSE